MAASAENRPNVRQIEKIDGYVPECVCELYKFAGMYGESVDMNVKWMSWCRYRYEYPWLKDTRTPRDCA